MNSASLLHPAAGARPALAVAAPPSCCAGLLQTVLHGWRDRFPLHSSPFYVMSTRSGATPRELLAVCERLQRNGSLQPIRAQWGPHLRRARWRLGFAGAAARAPGLLAALAALPGCLRIEHGSADAPIWAELEALDEAGLRRQLAALPEPPTHQLLWQETPGAASDGPHADLALAALVERGLPLCAGPYERAAQQLGRSERQLLSTLRAWQRDGELAAMTLAPTATRSSGFGMLALWQSFTPSLEACATLRAQPGLQRLLISEAPPAWPWRFGLVLEAAEALASQQLGSLLMQAGITAAPELRMALRIERPRDAALLFAV
ncbi:hypothetical protein HNQ51_002309 [Inhella inkyongensis]|uniref:Siroheme decarboxylase NirL-like HTH domain-containing protein n=1 Tax=Inhella inkyongensis TaxID=392593 RepID=A0A840S9A6_9BURK|nr:hypothetical protein [Inhella inkyongensis]MBB5204990.1 hypothetical protein [Inhella inkyongensis]